MRSGKGRAAYGILLSVLLAGLTAARAGETEPEDTLQQTEYMGLKEPLQQMEYIDPEEISPQSKNNKPEDIRLHQAEYARPPVLTLPEEGTLMYGVSYEGFSVEGNTLEEAVSAMIGYAKEVCSRPVELTILGETFRYTAADFGMTWANPEVAGYLMNCLRTGSLQTDAALQRQLMDAPLNLDMQYVFDAGLLQNTILQHIQAASVTPQNASVTRANGTFVITEAVEGISFDAGSIFTAVYEAMSTDTTEPVAYTFPYEVTAPLYDNCSVEFSETPLGSFSTGGLGEGSRRQNIILAAENMNGHLFYPGELISTLNMYGPITAERGFGAAPGYERGRQVMTIGGGICQPTTTLYNAVLRAELRVAYRRNHSMMVNYVPPAMDATVSPADGGDFCFYNSTDDPIYIESYVEGDTITVNIWGKEVRPADRTISFRTEVLSIAWPEKLYTQIRDDTGCLPGAWHFSKKFYTVADPHPKMHARSYKIVTENGQSVPYLINDDTYGPMSGVLYHASDCYLDAAIKESTAADAVFPFIGYTVELDIRDSGGNPWPVYE